MKKSGTKVDSKKFVIYGDLVVIKSKIINYYEKQYQYGYFSCTGFTDDNIYFQSLDKKYVSGFNDEKLHLENQKMLQNMMQVIKEESQMSLIKEQEEERVDFSELRNYRDFIFQIWPQLSYQYHREYRKLQNQIKRFQVKRGFEDNVKPLLNQMKARLSELENRVLDEKQSNLSSLKNYLGIQVTYGHQIQLYHVDSKSFLIGKRQKSNKMNQPTLILSEQFSPGMFFQFVPKIKYRNLGDPVEFQDIFQIKHTQTGKYVNIKAETVCEMVQDYSHFDREIPLYQTIKLRSQQFQHKFYQVELDQICTAFFQLQRHGKHLPEGFEGKMRSHTLVRFKHNDLESYIAADFHYLLDKREVYLKKCEGESQVY